MWKAELINLLWKYGIIGVNFDEPVTFKSGIRSPIYCDFRKIQAYPDLRKLVTTGLMRMLDPRVDGIIGVATGAISHASIMSERLTLPSGYIRPDSKPKDYGLKKLIEGMDVIGKNIAIIEDLVSTAGSIINNAKIVQMSNAKSIELLSIFSYDMEVSKKELQESGFNLKSLITIHDVMPVLHQKLSPAEYSCLLNWVKDPEGWFDRYKKRFKMGFLTTLRNTDASIICMGIDSVLAAIPMEYAKQGIRGAAHFFSDLTSEMKRRDILPGMYKLNEGFYGKYGQEGRTAMGFLLESLLSEDDIKNKMHTRMNPPVIIDAKRGDIGKSSQNYAEEFLGDDINRWAGITVAPYMGEDSVMPFIKYCNKQDGKGVYILNKTSNPGSRDLQMLKMFDGRYLYQHVIDKIVEWAKGRPGVGAVVGGNSLEELSVIMKAYAGKNIPLLIPGVGAQGGSAKEVANVARQTGFELSLIRINSSSGLTHPWYKKPGDAIPSTNECIEICINELNTLNHEVGLLETAEMS